MSYVVQIWEQPLGYAWPRKVDDAVRWVEYLQELQPGQNPRFLEFARRLTSTYPDISSPEAGQIPVSQQAWSDGPLDGRTDEMVYAIGIANGEKFLEVRRFVLATARKLGLAVADDQAGEFHYPSGLVLDIKDRLLPLRVPDKTGSCAADLGSTEDLLDMISLSLAAKLRPRGFTLLPPNPPDASVSYATRDLQLLTASGWHRLTVTAYDRRPGYMAFGMDVASCCRAVSDLQRRIDAGVAPDAPLPRSPIDPQRPAIDPDDRGTTFLRQEHWLVDPDSLTGTESVLYILLNPADLTRALEHLVDQIEHRLLPLLKCYDSLESLDAAFNSTFDVTSLKSSVFFSGYYRYSLHHLLAAYLAGNPRLAAMCDKFEGMIDKEGRTAFAGAADQVRACLAYVRRH